MISAIRTGEFDVSLDDTAVADLDNAGDIALVDDNIYDIQRLLDAPNIKAKSWGLKINVKKTELCSNQEDALLSCNGIQLNLVEHFTYLGSSIQLNGDIAQEVKSRIGRAAQRYKNLDKFWCMKNIPGSLKIKVYNACITSVLLYSCETWPLRASELKRLMGFDKRCRLRTLGDPTVTNNLDVFSIKSIRLGWLGHVLGCARTVSPTPPLSLSRGPLGSGHLVV